MKTIIAIVFMASALYLLSGIKSQMPPKVYPICKTHVEGGLIVFNEYPCRDAYDGEVYGVRP
jgi:hypothetical protein